MVRVSVELLKGKKNKKQKEEEEEEEKIRRLKSLKRCHACAKSFQLSMRLEQSFVNWE